VAAVIKTITSLILYTCLATLISQIAIVGYGWTSGTIDRHKLEQIAAVIAGTQMIPADEAPSADLLDESHQDISYEEILQQRATQSLNLDLREQAVSKGLSDLRGLVTQLQEDTRRFDMRRQAFQDNLKQLEEGAKGAAINEVRLTLEAMRPRQAKDQMIRMLEEDQMEAVVTIIKGMAVDKRKKLLAEFKAGDEPDKLAEILQEILQGIPETTAIQQAQNSLATPPS
jgi:hypothetical protein